MASEDQTPPEKSHSKYSNNSNVNPRRDSSKPYFVHYSDQLGHILIPTKSEWCQLFGDKLGEWIFKSRSRDTFHEGYMFPMLVTEEFDVWPEKNGLGKDGSGMVEPVQVQVTDTRAVLGNQPKKLDPKLEVQAGDSYKAVIQKKAIARF
ncbi:SUPPRESSOR OF ABI3-5 [Olea europaea subsp. europaea]|uniref:SUPPRESSOR OF ABI3-5 n=1 Tax=Olea europaea subsp. europaea TaxID=158383 RepID=A0A8S0TV07_OLEEU|nr:SUPPRESSOR OF ABI3-5 [Olea europaea subsp. europaea]